MSPARQEPESEPTTRLAYPRTRYRRQPKATESETPLSHLRRRYANGAIAASIGYLVVMVTTLRPTALNTAATIGLLIAFGAAAGLCALGAILTWSVDHLPQALLDQQAETVEWAIRLGEDMADAFRTAPSGSPRPR